MNIFNAPQLIEIHPTNVCNSNCFFCNQKQLHQNDNSMDFHMLQNVLNTLIKKGLKRVRISGGGEPLCYPFFEDIMRILQENQIDIIGLNTNGILLINHIKLLTENMFFKKLCISLQAPTANEWSKITRNKPSVFYRILDSLHEYADNNKFSQQMVLSFVLCEETVNHIDSMIDIANELNAQCFLQDLNCYKYSDAFVEEILTKEAFLNYCNKDKITCYFNNIPRINHLSSFQKGNNIQRNREISKNFCTAPWTGILLRPNGNCYICCALGGDKHIIGNIYINDIVDIWQSQEAQEIREEAFSYLIKNNEKQPKYFYSKCKELCCVRNSLFSNQNDIERIFRHYNIL